MFGQQLFRLFFGIADFGMRRQVNVALFLNPGQALAGRPLKEAVLLILIQPLLLGGPVLQHPILLSQQLLQDY